MKYLSIGIPLICGLLLSSCTTKLESYQVTEENLGTPTDVSSYYLKRQDFGVRITRKLTSCDMTTTVSGNEVITGKTSPISVQSELIPNLDADPQYRFAIPYDTLSSGSKTSNLEIEFYPNRTIKSINATVEDQTAEIIESTVSIVGTAVGAVLSGGSSLLALAKSNFLLTDQDESSVNICTPEAVTALADKREKETAIKASAGTIKKYLEEIEIAKLVLAHKKSNVGDIWAELIDLKSKIRTEENDIAKNKSDLNGVNEFLTDVSYQAFKPDWYKNEKGKDFFTTEHSYSFSSEKKRQWFKETHTENIIKLKTTFSTNLRMSIKDSLQLGNDTQDNNKFITNFLEEDNFSDDVNEILETATNVHIALALQAPARKVANSIFPQPIKVDMGLPKDTEIIKDKIMDGLLFREPIEGDIFICAGEACNAEPNTIIEAIDKAKREKGQVLANAEADQSVAAQALALKNAAASMSYKGRFVIPQAGAVLRLTLENGPFEENSVSLAFTNDGRISKFSYGENAALTTAMASLANTVQTGAEVYQGVKNADLDKMLLENKELEAKKNKLTILKELRVLEAEGIE